jgi:hypothetical protein
MKTSTRHISALIATLGVTCLAPRAARSEPIRTIDSPRILVVDVVSAADGGDVELGPAPPPGGSRLVERREVEARLRESGGTAAKLDMPAVVRVVRAARRMTPTELHAEAEPVLTAALPMGVSLVSLQFSRGIVVPPHAAVRKASVPKLPHRAGPMKTTVMFEIIEGADVAARVPGTVTLDISERAAQPTVVRGARLDVVIEKGPARVTAVGFALSDADVGEVVSVRVDSTQRILEARVESGQSAKVVRK